MNVKEQIMEQKQANDFLIRNLPIEIYALLEKAAKENHHSKTQAAIVALSHGLAFYCNKIKQPIPFKWKNKISNKFIDEAIKEGQKRSLLIQVGNSGRVK